VAQAQPFGRGQDRDHHVERHTLGHLDQVDQHRLRDDEYQDHRRTPAQQVQLGRRRREQEVLARRPKMANSAASTAARKKIQSQIGAMVSMDTPVERGRGSRLKVLLKTAVLCRPGLPARSRRVLFSGDR
jgi:hypothetical protein